MNSLCEIVAFEMLPSIRAEVARILKEKYKLSQNEIAKILGVTQASISYYLNELRGRRRVEYKELNNLCESLIKNLISAEEFRIKLNKIACEIANRMYKIEKPCNL